MALKTALVTGGTRGVGKEITKMFLNRNINVIMTGRNIENVKKIEYEINKNNKNKKARVTGYKLNFTDLDGSSEILNKLKNKEIKPTYLINNAGVLMLDDMKNITPKRMEIMYSVNTFGPLLLTKYCMEDMWKKKYGAILFNSPPYIIDDKTKYLMPYMQTKLAQTTFMKSLAHSISKKQNTNINTDLDILVSSFWTNYPLLTDAILKNGVGSEEDCMHPSILSKTVEELLFNTKNRQDYIGREIIDKTFLEQQNVDITPFKISKKKDIENIDNLDNLFLKHLQKLNPKKNREFLLPGV
tara:strand:+ start:285 stop:1181 length:897 start_codon:yes stop_codon:yes gene_type:complete